MNGRLPIPTAISYVKVSNVPSFKTSLTNSVQMDGVAWTNIPMVPGTVNFEIQEKTEKGNPTYTIELSAGVQEPLPKLGQVIIKLEFESGDILTIGEPDYPVIIQQGQNLTRKSFALQHKSSHYPYDLQ